MERNKGITIVSLIITIIILLVLVSVSIMVLINEEIIGKADEAVEVTRAAYEQEEAAGSKYKIKGNTYNSMSEYMGSIDDDETLDDKIEKALENREGDEEIGIGTDGELVDLNLWYYYEYRQGQMALGMGNGSFHFERGYLGDIVNGEIIGSVPQYIIPEGEDKIYPVTSLEGTFYNITNLIIAPEIPSTVELSTSVFQGCTSLTTAPEIPSSLTSMDSMFYGCTSLATAPEIPSTVNYMFSTFEGCSSLTGDLVINMDLVNASQITYCFKDAATNSGCDLKLTGTSTQLNVFLDTASANSHISLK